MIRKNKLFSLVKINQHRLIVSTGEVLCGVIEETSEPIDRVFGNTCEVVFVINVVESISDFVTFKKLPTVER